MQHDELEPRQGRILCVEQARKSILGYIPDVERNHRCSPGRILKWRALRNKRGSKRVLRTILLELHAPERFSTCHKQHSNGSRS